MGMAAAWLAPSLRRRFAGGEDGCGGAAAGGGAFCDDDECFPRFREPPRRRRLRPPAADSCGGSMGNARRTRRGFLPLVPAVCAAGIVAWAAITLAGPEAVSLGRAFLAGRASFLFRYMCSNKRGSVFCIPQIIAMVWYSSLVFHLAQELTN